MGKEVIVIRVEDVDVFKLAHDWRSRFTRQPKVFPNENCSALIEQTRGAATSVGMNLMEGAMRFGSREYRQFEGIARGSAGEVCYQLLRASLKYISNETYLELRSGYDPVIQMLLRSSQWLNQKSKVRSRDS